MNSIYRKKKEYIFLTLKTPMYPSINYINLFHFDKNMSKNNNKRLVYNYHFHFNSKYIKYRY
jgi:hypothetical protein